STMGQAVTTHSTRRRSDPKKLSQLMRGELDWIVMKALEKDRNRRYESASAFAADVQRYLSAEPVAACPPSAWYRFGSFSRRNRGALVATAVGTLVVIFGVAGLIVNNWMVAQETKKKEAALETALAEQTRADRNQARFKEVMQEFFANTAKDRRLK